VIARAFVTGGSGFIGGALIRALRSEGIKVRALARSDASAKTVERIGAEAVRGDLSDEIALARGMQDCQVVFHAAANPQDHDLKRALEDNLEGSLRIVRAAQRSAVQRVVYLSGIGVLFGRGRLHNVDERHPRGKRRGALIASRIASEEAMVLANSVALPIVVVRLPYVWGPGNTLVPALVAAVSTGRFRWIGNGRHSISILHVQNAVRGLLKAAEHGRGGEVYWLSDGAPVELRTFFERQLRHAGVSPPTAELGFRIAYALATALELSAKLLGRAAPLTRATVRFLGQEITIDDTKARRELGYESTAYWPDGPM
jgi:nucleoside-diphosphate-sugar epimerase